MQNVRSLIKNHDNENGFLFYSIDHGPNAVSRNERERIVSFPVARKFVNDQREAGRSVGVFYVYSD